MPSPESQINELQNRTFRCQLILELEETEEKKNQEDAFLFVLKTYKTFPSVIQLFTYSS